MESYDVFMLIVLGGSALLGMWKGAAWQVASLASYLVSGIVAVRFSGAAAPMFGQAEWAPFAAMLVLYLGTSLAIWVLFRMVKGTIDRLKLKEFDRQIGSLLGLTKGLVLCLIITFFVVTLSSETTRQGIARSISGHAARTLIRQGAPLIPEPARAASAKYFQDLDRGLEDRPGGAAPPAEKTAPADREPPPNPEPRSFPPLPKLPATWPAVPVEPGSKGNQSADERWIERPRICGEFRPYDRT